MSTNNNHQKDGRTISGKKSSQGGNSNPEKASPLAIERYIKGIHFPADKDDLIEKSKKNNAPDDVMKVLSKFEEKEYKSVIDISKEVGRIE